MPARCGEACHLLVPPAMVLAPSTPGEKSNVTSAAECWPGTNKGSKYHILSSLPNPPFCDVQKISQSSPWGERWSPSKTSARSFYYVSEPSRVHEKCSHLPISTQRFIWSGGGVRSEYPEYRFQASTSECTCPSTTLLSTLFEVGMAEHD